MSDEQKSRFVYLDGYKLPIIAGGADEDDSDTSDDSSDDSDRPLTLSDLETALQPLLEHINKMGEAYQQHQENFDELVEALAGVVDAEDSGEGDDEGEDDDNSEAATRRQSNSNSDDMAIAMERRERMKLQKQLEEMQSRLQQRDEEAAEQHEMYLASERDRLLAEALQKAGVVPEAIDHGIKIFRDDVVYDDESGNFYFEESSTGMKLPIDEGITDNLPDYLKASKVTASGSGGRGSQASSLIDKARKDMQQLSEKAQKTGADSDIAQYHAAKKKLMSLEKDVTDKSSGSRRPTPPRPQVPAQVGSGDDDE